jgi:hypothetical protein
LGALGASMIAGPDLRTLTGNPGEQQAQVLHDVFTLEKGMWKKGDLIGSGAFGNVFRALTAEGALFAVKEIVIRSDTPRANVRIYTYIHTYTHTYTHV